MVRSLMSAHTCLVKPEGPACGLLHCPVSIVEQRDFPQGLVGGYNLRSPLCHLALAHGPADGAEPQVVDQRGYWADICCRAHRFPLPLTRLKQRVVL
eukprot:1159968-Pelagomonas_calceolata.AAC.11